MNKVFNEKNCKSHKLEIHAYKEKIQTNLSFEDGLGDKNGMITTEFASNNRNNLYYMNEEGILFPVNNSSQRFYEQMVDSVSINGNLPETSIFDTTGSIGRLDILPNITRVGSKYNLKAHGIIESSSNSRFIIRTKLGNAIIEHQEITLPNLESGSFFELDLELRVKAIGDAGTARIYTFGKFNFIKNNGVSTSIFIDDYNNTTYQTTALAEADVTIEWLSANSNVISFHAVSINMLN